jgi:large subunit ribosomal protein L3
MGNKRRLASNLQILKVIADKNIVIVKGSIPGANGSTVTIRK